MEEVIFIISKILEASDIITFIKLVNDLTLLLNESLFNLPDFGPSLVTSGIIGVLLSKVFHSLLIIIYYYH